MLKKLAKLLFNSAKTANKTSHKSMDFIDDLLEKEYLTSAVDNLKTSSGKIVEKAGMVYQQTKDTFDEKVDLDKLKDVGDKIIAKGKDLTEDLSENMQEGASTLKNVMKEGEKIVGDLIDDVKDGVKQSEKIASDIIDDVKDGGEEE